VELGHVFAAGALRSTAYVVSVTHRTECRAACLWTAVRSVYGQPKSKNGNIFQALLLYDSGPNSSIIIANHFIESMEDYSYFYYYFLMDNMSNCLWSSVAVGY
jgi:hypothetical protein